MTQHHGIPIHEANTHTLAHVLGTRLLNRLADDEDGDDIIVGHIETVLYDLPDEIIIRAANQCLHGKQYTLIEKEKHHGITATQSIAA